MPATRLNDVRCSRGTNPKATPTSPFSRGRSVLSETANQGTGNGGLLSLGRYRENQRHHEGFSTAALRKSRSSR
jgi:hypothetical protein